MVPLNENLLATAHEILGISTSRSNSTGNIRTRVVGFHPDRLTIKASKVIPMTEIGLYRKTLEECLIAFENYTRWIDIGDDGKPLSKERCQSIAKAMDRHIRSVLYPSNDEEPDILEQLQCLEEELIQQDDDGDALILCRARETIIALRKRLPAHFFTISPT